jgi:hypothetical protein
MTSSEVCARCGAPADYWWEPDGDEGGVGMIVTEVRYSHTMYSGNPKGDQYGWKVEIEGRNLKELRRILALLALEQRKKP